MRGGRAQQMLATQRPLRCINKGDQQRVFAFRQYDEIATRVDQAPPCPIEFPTTEPTTSVVYITLWIT